MAAPCGMVAHRQQATGLHIVFVLDRYSISVVGTG
jgi:hypothetical protein